MSCYNNNNNLLLELTDVFLKFSIKFCEITDIAALAEQFDSMVFSLSNQIFRLQ